MTQQTDDGKARYLVLHDYGMGGLWWWVRARSPKEILETYAEVEVVSADIEAVQRAETWSLDEIDIDAPDPNPPTDLYDPKLASMVISPQEFEDAWNLAHKDVSA